MPDLTRRDMLAGAAAAAGAATAVIAGNAAGPRAALAAETPPADQAAGGQAAGIYRYRIGDLNLTAIHDGIWWKPIDDKFVRNAPFAEVQKALADAFEPTEVLPIPFTALLVESGARRILIDTGTAGQVTKTAGTLAAGLARAGVDPGAIDTIVISHFHPDHINGIKTKDDTLFFPRAEIIVPEPEWAFWMDDAHMAAAGPDTHGYFLNARRIFRDIAKDVRRFAPGREVAPGITSIPAYGHTPGHTAFAIASGNESMLLLSDTTNNPLLFARHPDWQPILDMDGAMAVDTRHKLLDRAAADRMLVQGYHFPFPASGHIVRTATGYDLVPVLWQSAL